MNHIRSLNMSKKLRLVAAIGMTLGSLASVQGQSFLTNGLVAYYPFNGNANDAVGTNHGVVEGATLGVDRFGSANSAYLFDGISNRILASIASIPTKSTNRSLISWVKITGSLTTTAFYVPVDWGTNNDNQAFGFITGSLPKIWGIHFWGGGQDVDSPQVPDNNWHQLAAVLENNVAKLYYDGVLKVSRSKTANTGYGPLCIGTGIETLGTGRTYFPGYVDDVRIYNRALSSNEIAMLYFYESKPKVNLVKMYTLDFDSLTVGTNYQLQVSTNLLSWTNWGSTFTATSVRYTNAVPIQRVDDWSKIFFRLDPK